MGSVPCPICQRPDQSAMRDGARHLCWHECLTCGEFGMTGTAQAVLGNLSSQQRAVLSAVLKEATMRGDPPIEVSTYNLDSLSSPTRIPRTVGERLERIGRSLETRQEAVGLTVNVIPMDDYPIAFARNAAEFTNMLVLLSEMGRIERPHLGRPTEPLSIRLTANGVEWLDSIRLARPTEGNLVFVGMRFSEEMRPYWEPGFYLGCKEAGYEAKRTDRHPHNEPWIDRIMALIRESRFMVADLSDRAANAGVGFEAGFAKGLGRDVIFTCMDSKWAAAEAAKEENERFGPLVHANFKQFTVIRWKDAADLKEQLRDRILGTIGRHAPLGGAA